MTKKTRVQSVSRACLILQLLGVKKGLTTLEISQYLELNRSTTHHLISTLQDYGFVKLYEDNKYYLGPALYELTNQISGSILTNLVHEILENIVSSTKETAYFSIFHKGVVCLDIVSGEGALRVVQPFPDPGEPANLHARSSGKLFLSTLTKEELNQYLQSNPLEKLAEKTILNKEELIVHLKKIREQGYAEDDEEFCNGVICYAHPITINKNIIGCISTSLPSARRNKYSDVIKIIRQTAEKLENLIDENSLNELLEKNN